MKKELTINEIERQGPEEPIWVINTSGDHPRTRQIGELVLSVPIQGAPNENIKLPATWLPYNLTSRIPRRFLLDTPLLRRYADDKLLKFITAEYAEVLLNYEGAEEERQEIARREASINQAGSARTLEDAPVKVLMGNDAKNAKDARDFADFAEDGHQKRAPEVSDDYLQSVERGVAAKASSEPQISTLFNSWMQGVAGKSDLATLNSLRTHGRNFTRKEILYWVESGALRDKPQTLASVQRTLQRTLQRTKSKSK